MDKRPVSNTHNGSIRHLLCLCVVALSATLVGQTTQLDSYRFDVSSIKRNESGSGSMTVGARGQRFLAENVTPLVLMMNGYPIEARRITGAPRWMTTDRYDVVGVSEAVLNAETLQAMVRSMLAERLSLKVHRETRRLRSYRLVQDRVGNPPGPSLRRWNVDCEARLSERLPDTPLKPVATLDGVPPCGMQARPGYYAASGITLAELTASLATTLATPVVDETGLQGEYELVLRWSPEAAADPDAAYPELFTALREQLGLKLESLIAPAEVIVIDSVARPTPD